MSAMQEGHDDPGRVLVGDVGGTKTLLAIASRSRTGWTIDRRERFASAEHDDLRGPVRAFLGNGVPPEAACFGVAGPVIGRRVEGTNLPWVVDADELERSLAIPHVELANDLAATAMGTELLDPASLEIVQVGDAEPRGTRAVIAPGTGLGEGLLVRHRGQALPLPTEGGHVSFAPRGPEQVELLRRVEEEVGGRVSLDRILSGPGLVRIYRMFRDRGEAPEDPAVGLALARGDGPAAITEAALERSEPISARALETFVAIFGAVAGDVALRSLATAGVYLAGGIAPRIAPALRGDTFREAFLDKGRFRPFVERVPVLLVRDPDVTLLGAAALA